MAARLKERYLNEVTPALLQKFNYTSVMQVPKIEKVVINMGVGDAVGNPKVMDVAADEMKTIAGQKPVITKAKKINRWFQSSRRYADWSEGHTSRRTDVSLS